MFSRLVDFLVRGVQAEARVFARDVRERHALSFFYYIAHLPNRRARQVAGFLSIPLRPVALGLEAQRFKRSHRPLDWQTISPESPSAEEAAAFFKDRVEPRFFPGVSVMPRDVDTADSDAITAEAGSILDGRIRVLGIDIDSKSPVMWRSDPPSGKVWPKRYFKRLLPVANTVDDTDVKIPWELSRLNHLLTLGIAYRLTRDEKYANALADQMDDWWEQNPYKTGVNWTLAMDVAMRSANMILAFYLSRESRAWTPARTLRLVSSVQEHGDYVMENLENAGITSNHYLSNIAGLLYISEMFPELPSAREWNIFARRELELEIVKQTNADGSNSEASTCYHRLVLEMFFACALLCRTNGRALSGAYDAKLRGMFEFVQGYLKPDGSAPLIGDNDSARWHRLFPRDDRDHSYLTTLGALYFDDASLLSPTSGLGLECWVFFGQDGARLFAELKAAAPQPAVSASFPDFGLYVARNERNYLSVSCGLNAQIEGASGGHAHNDKLSFELMFHNVDIVQDPGVFTYTRSTSDRDTFRETRSHNTVTVDGKEQNPIRDYWPFMLEDVSQARAMSIDEGAPQWALTAEHYGYLRLRPGVVHRRTFRFRGETGELTIADELIHPNGESEKRRRLEWSFHLAEGSEAEITGGTARIRREGVSVCTEINGPNGLDWRVAEGWLAPAYGVRVSAPVLRASGSFPLPVSVETRWWVDN